MDMLQRIKNNLEWNDSSEPARDLRKVGEETILSRVADESFAESEDVCRGCLISVINPGDEIIPTGLPEGGFYKVRCACADAKVSE